MSVDGSLVDGKVLNNVILWDRLSLIWLSRIEHWCNDIVINMHIFHFTSQVFSAILEQEHHELPPKHIEVHEDPPSLRNKHSGMIWWGRYILHANGNITIRQLLIPVITISVCKYNRHIIFSDCSWSDLSFS